MHTRAVLGASNLRNGVECPRYLADVGVEKQLAAHEHVALAVVSDMLTTSDIEVLAPFVAA